MKTSTEVSDTARESSQNSIPIFPKIRLNVLDIQNDTWGKFLASFRDFE